MDGTLLDLHYDNIVWGSLLPAHYARHHGTSTDDADAHLSAHMRQIYGTIDFYCLDYWARFTDLDIMAPHREAAHLIDWRPNAREFLLRLSEQNIPKLLVTNAHHDSIAI